jgi:hypothetical protein
MLSMSKFSVIAAAGAAMALLGSAASAQSVSPVVVTPKAPTEVRIVLTGKTPKLVRKEIRIAAGAVCFNAVLNGDLHFTDYRECASLSQRKALSRFAAIRAAHPALAEAGALRLAVR